MKRFLRNIVLRMTHRMWYRRILPALRRMYDENVIDSSQFRALVQRFDPNNKKSDNLYK